MNCYSNGTSYSLKNGVAGGQGCEFKAKCVHV
jgi:hypothetical protein